MGLPAAVSGVPRAPHSFPRLLEPRALSPEQDLPLAGVSAAAWAGAALITDHAPDSPGESFPGEGLQWWVRCMSVWLAKTW